MHVVTSTPDPHSAEPAGEVKVVIKDGPVDEVDFSKIGLEEAFKLLNVSMRA